MQCRGCSTSTKHVNKHKQKTTMDTIKYTYADSNDDTIVCSVVAAARKQNT